MARGVRLTKAERELLKQLFTPGASDLSRPRTMDLSSFGRSANKTALAILAKVEASEESGRGVDIVPIEEALVAAARGKVVALEAGHARASVQAKAVGATPETAKLVGAWMARQGWLQGPQTVLDVMNKWYQWLPKARATEPPPSLAPGLGPAGKPDADTRQGTGSPSPAHPSGRSTPGFR